MGFRDKYKKLMLPAARNISKQILTLPLYENLDMRSISDICTIINDTKERKH